MKSIKHFGLKLTLLMALTVSIAFGTQTVYADNTGADFSVSLNQSNTQADASKPYFDLSLKPQQTAKFKITIFNNSNESNDFEVFANNAITNQNLIIDYSPIKNQSDYLVNQHYDFKKIVSPNQTKVRIPGHSSKQVEFKVKMPTQKFDGQVLGGIYVRKVLKEHVKNGYTNRFNFVTSVLIHENQQNLSPSLKIKKVDLKPSQFNNQLQINMENPAMTYANNLKVSTKVYDQQHHQVLSVKNDQRSIAPNSQFSYLIPLNQQHLKSGKYLLKLEIKDQKNGRTWYLKKGFVVSRQKSIQATDSYKTITAVPIWYLIFAGLLGLIIILLIVLIFKRRKTK